MAYELKASSYNPLKDSNAVKGLTTQIVWKSFGGTDIHL